MSHSTGAYAVCVGHLRNGKDGRVITPFHSRMTTARNMNHAVSNDIFKRHTDGQEN